jgi:hypothetical protein
LRFSRLERLIAETGRVDKFGVPTRLIMLYLAKTVLLPGIIKSSSYIGGEESWKDCFHAVRALDGGGERDTPYLLLSDHPLPAGTEGENNLIL